jgi:hypothetical protein
LNSPTLPLFPIGTEEWRRRRVELCDAMCACEARALTAVYSAVKSDNFWKLRFEKKKSKRSKAKQTQIVVNEVCTIFIRDFERGQIPITFHEYSVFEGER